MTETMKNLTNETADGAGEGVAHVATNGQAADDGKPIIRICDLHKSYDDLVVLRGVDLEVKRGEVVVILGPSGSGKSTLLRCVNLLEQPTGGQVFFEDTEITAKGTDINAVRANSALKGLRTVESELQANALTFPGGSLPCRELCWRGSLRFKCMYALRGRKRRAPVREREPFNNCAAECAESGFVSRTFLAAL